MMAAVVGLDISRLTDMINESGKKVYIANHNDHKQIVISGIKDDVIQLISFLKEKGIRRVIPLKVNIASHCPLMEEVSERLYEYIDKNIDFKDSETAFYSSTELKFLDKEDIPICLKKQLTSPIRWVDSIENLADEKSMFIEIGPGNILSKIVKNIVKKADYKDIEVLNTDSYEQIEHVINYIKEVI